MGNKIGIVQLRRVAVQSEVVLLVVILLLGTFVSFRAENFLSTTNLFNAALAMVTVGIVAYGQAFVIIAGELDLSVGSTIAFTAVSAGWFIERGLNPWVAVVVAITMGALVGLVNALIVVYGGVNSFVVTLGTLSVVRGGTLLITEGLPIGMPDTLDVLGRQTKWGPAPLPVIVMVVLGVVAHMILKLTVFGRRVQAVGDNDEAARLAGIPVNQTRILVFMIAGALAGLAGIIRAASLGVADASAGEADLLPIIAAVVVGGAALTGGKGSMIGVLFGALLLGVVQNAYVILRLSGFLQELTFGAVIVVAGLFDRARAGQFAEVSRFLRRRPRDERGSPPPERSDQASIETVVTGSTTDQGVDA